jgi:hypothetical protein
MANVLHVRPEQPEEPEMITFFATDFLGLCGALESALTGVWTFFVSAPAAIASIF